MITRRTLALSSALAIALVAAAVAGETVGTITAIDDTTREVTLDDGYTYSLGDPECSAETLCPLESFDVGDKVRIVWEPRNEARFATEMAGVPE